MTINYVHTPWTKCWIESIINRLDIFSFSFFYEGLMIDLDCDMWNNDTIYKEKVNFTVNRYWQTVCKHYGYNCGIIAHMNDWNKWRLIKLSMIKKKTFWVS